MGKGASEESVGSSAMLFGRTSGRVARAFGERILTSLSPEVTLGGRRESHFSSESRLESSGRLLPVTGERSAEQVLAGLLLLAPGRVDDSESVAGGGLRAAGDVEPAWQGVKLMEWSDWLGRRSVGVGVRGSSVTGLTVAKLSLDSAVVGDCTTPGDVTSEAAPKTNGLSCLRSGTLKGRTAAAAEVGMLADITAGVTSLGQLKSCLHSFLLLLPPSSSALASDGVSCGDVSRGVTSPLLHCFSNSSSWPRKLKLGEIVGRLSLTYLKIATKHK